MRRTPRTFLLVWAAVSTSILLGASPASATLGESLFPRNAGQPRCTVVDEGLNNTNGDILLHTGLMPVVTSGGGYVQTVIGSLGASGCTYQDPTWNRNPGYIAASHAMYKWLGYDAVCQATQSGTYTNPANTWRYYIASNYGASPRCGSGTYRSIGTGFVLGNSLDPTWLGGNAGTGYIPL